MCDVGKKISNRYKGKVGQIILFLLVKYLYIYACFDNLKYASYVSEMNYNIHFSMKKEIFASVLFLIVLSLLYKEKDENFFGEFSIYLLVVVYYIPLNSAFALNDTNIKFCILSNFYFAIILWLYKKISISEKREADDFLLRTKNASLICIIVCCIYIVFKFQYNGIMIYDSKLGMYGIRSEFQEYMWKISGEKRAYFWTVINNLVAYAWFYLMYVGMKYKKHIYTIVAIITIISEFSVFAAKGTICTAGIIFIVYFYEKIFHMRDLKKHLNIGVLILMIISAIGNKIGIFRKIFILFVRRIFFYPAWLDTLYYDHFYNKTKLYYSQCVIGIQKILPKTYNESVLDMINNKYYGGNVPSPNTGMFAEGYMQAGVLGIILQACLVVSLIYFSAKIYGEYSEGFKMIVIVKLILSMTNVPVLRTDFVLSYVLFTCIIFINNKYDEFTLNKKDFL